MQATTTQRGHAPRTTRAPSPAKEIAGGATGAGWLILRVMEGAYRGAVDAFWRHFRLMRAGAKGSADRHDVLLRAGEDIYRLFEPLAEAAVNGVGDRVRRLALDITRGALSGLSPTYRYARYERSAEHPGFQLEDLPRHVQGLPLREALPPNKLSRMIERGLEYGVSQIHFPERLIAAYRQCADPFEAYFGGFVERRHHVVEHWRDDTELARQLIQGLNPMVIRVCRSIDEVPRSMAHLTAQGQPLRQLIDEGRLFILDYDLLTGFDLHRDMVFYAPIMLVYRERLEGGASRLNILGIQLTRHEGDNEVYTAETSPPNRYLFAKMHVACADNQYHQFIFHLGLAHLAMEPVVVAHQNAFLCEPNHMIGRLLRPHLYGTVGINFLARQTLVTDPQEAFTDRTFAPGTVQALELFRRYWQTYDFFKDSFPEELAARGFDEAGTDGVEGYYYRDDGFKIWRALEEYVCDVVAVTYADDKAVAADRTLQIFAWECSSPERGAIPGFPAAFDSRELLVKALTAILFRASAFHAAVNYPQLDYLSYVPNRPDSLRAAMPEGGKEVSREFILKALPGPRASHFQISFAYLLTTPSENPITRLNVFAEDLPEIHERLMGNLAKISAEIRARNDALAKAGRPTYPYLMPELIPASVNI